MFSLTNIKLMHRLKNQTLQNQLKFNLNFNELEYQERELALKEREILLRECEAKVHVMELSNLEKEQELKLH
ncbi:kinase-like domain-containing protein [Rhizophagus irregularis DAOM 181602=DAOM 197198]|nr:kinase-like domain-containing protein [Rhizophagus irregularis DAOM 181602=DAOM 197198]